MTAPRFSIVICNYNYGRFVGEAIESCLAQTYPPGLYDVIVVDDGSMDESRAVIASYAGHSNLVSIFQENHGQAGAFSTGVARASGDFVCLLDSDDYFMPDKLHRLASYLAFLRAGDRPDAVYFERHLHVHRYVSLCGVTACDIRIVDDNAVLLHAGLLSGSGTWKHALQFVPPLATSLGEWVLALCRRTSCDATPISMHCFKSSLTLY